MRITSGMMKNNYLNGMTTNLNNMQTLNKQLTSGKEISRPSDNPYKVARSMQLNTDINTNKQYNENIKDTINWLNTTDTALGQVTNVIQRVRELMVSSGNASYGSNEQKAISDEINQRIEEVAQILNSNFDGKYVFGGTKTSSKPLGSDTDGITGNTYLYFVDKSGNKLDLEDTSTYTKNQLEMLGTKMNVEISQGVEMEYNVTAKEVLICKDDNGKQVNLMNLLSDITSNLKSSNSSDRVKVIGENLADIDSVVSNLLKLRAEVGAKQNRMDSAQTKNEDENYNMTDILSKTEDIDFTEKTIEFTVAQTVYQASLQICAQVLPKSLLDYL
ncbi:MAG: flagellar hook-associated protein FlgL [Clostridium sp.]|nr:flagellar hook-associated protein FlgL [Clostridium sp.]